jgi:Tfp pilus assembly protein FimT
MGLLAVLAVPALKGLTGSGGRKQALGQLIGALELARNTAISSGTNAGVIFPTDSMSIPGYAYRTMAVVTWGTTSTNNEAEMVGDWISLPRGIAFFPGSLAATNLVTATNITYRILTEKITNGTFNAVLFQRDGGLLAGINGGTPSYPTNGVAFFEGTVENGTAKTNTAQPKFERVKLARYTGRVIPTLTNAP